MYVATTASDAHVSFVGAASTGILATRDYQLGLRERGYLRLPQSLADRPTRVAAHMVLLTKLFASPPPRFRPAKDACKELGRSCPPTCSGVGFGNKRSAKGGQEYSRSNSPSNGDGNMCVWKSLSL